MSEAVKEELENTSPEETQGRVMSRRAANKGKKAIDKKANTLKELQIEYVPIDSLKPNDYNPNRQSEHDFELLLRSMEEDGFTQPIVAIKGSRTIVDGEHRWRGAAALGLESIPVVFTDMTEEQAKIATLRHNRARGSEDYDLTANVLKDLELLGALDWAQDSLMLDNTELEKLLEDVAAPEAHAAEEYSESWDVGQDDTLDESEERPDGSMRRSVTPETLEKIREAEVKAKEAKNEEERSQARKEAQVYRLSLVFAGDEADIVRDILGDNAAQTILDMCREKGGLLDEDEV